MLNWIVSLFLSNIFLLAQTANFDFLLEKEISYEEKLGQMIIFNILPNTDKDFIVKLIRDYKVGNFNLIGKFKDEKEVKRILEIIKQESKKELVAEPFIAVDEEGNIERLIFLNSISQNKFKTLSQAYKESLRRGRELKKNGINMVFSPVLDFSEDKEDFIWKRTFQKNKNTSINLGVSMIKGYQDAKIISVPKHFPGYVGQSEDPHGRILKEKKLKFYSNSIEVFKEVLNKTNPSALMTAHLVIEEFGKKPITRSSSFVDFIRNKLKYDGLLITDSLGMRSFRLNDSFNQSALESLLSGHNLLILSSNQKVSLEILDFLRSKLNDNNVQLKVDESFLKILLFKRKTGLVY